MFSIDRGKTGVGIFSNKKIPAIFTDGGGNGQFTIVQKEKYFFIYLWS